MNCSGPNSVVASSSTVSPGCTTGDDHSITPSLVEFLSFEGTLGGLFPSGGEIDEGSILSEPPVKPNVICRSEAFFPVVFLTLTWDADAIKFSFDSRAVL